MSKENWDKIFEEGRDFNPLNVIFFDTLLARLKDINSESGNNHDFNSVIDFGCGTGDTALKFAEKGFKVQGIDWSEVALEKAKKRIDEKGFEDKISLTKMNLEELDLNKIIYKPSDVIFCKLTLAFIGNKDKFFEKVKELMSEKSVFVLITPVLHSDISYIPEDKPGIAVGLKELGELLNNKFNYIELFHHDYFSSKGDQVTFILKK